MAAVYPGYLNQGALSNTGPSEEDVKKNRAKQAEAEAKLKGKPFSALANPILEKEKASLGSVPPSTHDGRTYADGQPSEGSEDRGVLAEQNLQVPIPDPTENPGAAIAATSMNQATMSGNGAGLVPPPQAPQMQQVQREAADIEGKQVMFDMNKIPKPMESNAFNMGLMSFGLNLLSGNSYAEAFNQAGNHFNQAYGREKREAWAQDLVEQGYDAQDIQAWIESGDQKALSDPMEKKMKEQQFRLGQAQLSKAEYETSPEYLQYQQQRQEWDDSMKIAQFQQQQQFQNENLRNAQMGLDLQRQRLDLDMQKQAEARAAAQSKGSSGGAFSAGESQAYNHYTRAQSGMKNYEATIKETDGQISDGRMFGSKTLGGFADAKTIELALSGDPMQVQMARTLGNDKMVNTILAEKEWLSPVMRKDSGAAVSANEWNNMGNIYFPRPGDSESKVAQKQQAREVVTLSMNPRATPELRQVVDMYSAGALEGLRLRDGQAYAKKDGQWFAVPMF